MQNIRGEERPKKLLESGNAQRGKWYREWGMKCITGAIAFSLTTKVQYT